METRTSEITITPLNINVPQYTDYKNDDVVIKDKGYTEYLLSTNTRYGKFNYLKGDGMIGASMHLYGEYTQFEINLLHNFINSETIVYDIGSNIGYHTVGFAQKAKCVYSFEPNNKNYKLLRLNASRHKNIKLHNVAASNKNVDGHIEDYEPGQLNNYGELHLSNTGQPCKLVKLDDYITQEKLQPPHLIKIDVEGHEYEAIQGLDYTIKNNLPVIFYEHEHGDHLPEIYDYLTGLAYTVYWFACPNFNPTNYKNNTTNHYNRDAVINALAIPFHIQINTNLLKKESRTQTYQEAIEKYQKQNEAN